MDQQSWTSHFISEYFDNGLLSSVYDKSSISSDGVNSLRCVLLHLSGICGGD
uniref:Uncharacterized protein n=1 Tax=Arion vulgaris TaxID=1028688 RepID=A0A0B7B4F5_9EUPU